MAYATELTISTSNKVSINYQTRDVGVSVTYQLEREDADLVALVREKTQELAQAHRAAWQGLRDAKVAGAGQPQEVPEQPEENAPIRAEPKEAHSAPPLPASDDPAPIAVPAERIRPGQVAAILLLLTEARWSEQRRHGYLREKYSCNSIDELNVEQAKQWLLELQRAERERSEERRLHAAHMNGK